MSKSYLEESLFYKIETVRKEMITTGIREGLSSKNTIQLSQMLDQYVLQYQKLNLTSLKKNY
ncbi:aspartyl-phosphate phosphatase Spo0E family protein [Robertmurraya massiliosenegalensis]|uniref:aspartyl-phosphate phosphatase Spo0E family protein n=1 Tax=Robertmurraya TaxID=2837507 RepID=UPI0039A54A5B